MSMEHIRAYRPECSRQRSASHAPTSQIPRSQDGRRSSCASAHGIPRCGRRYDLWPNNPLERTAYRRAAHASKSDSRRSAYSLHAPPNDHAVFAQADLMRRDRRLRVVAPAFLVAAHDRSADPVHAGRGTPAEQNAGQYGKNRRERGQPIHGSPSGGSCRLSACRSVLRPWITNSQEIGCCLAQVSRVVIVFPSTGFARSSVLLQPTAQQPPRSDLFVNRTITV